MQLGDRLGWASLVMTFIGIGTAILWPAKRWIGWICLVCALALGIVWGYLELKDRHSTNKETGNPQQTATSTQPSQQSSSSPPTSPSPSSVNAATPKRGKGNVTGKQGAREKPISPPLVSTSGDNSPATGSISTGPCSNVQVGGNGNQATTNCLPPERHLSKQQIADLKTLVIPSQVELTLTAEGDTNSRTYAQEIFDACNGKITANNFVTSLNWSGAPPIEDCII